MTLLTAERRLIGLMVYLLSLFLLIIAPAEAKLPPFAEQYLKKIPGQKLSLPYVVATAVENAEVYKTLGYQYVSADLELSLLQSAEDFMLTGGANYGDDATVKTNTTFQPLRTKTWDWNLGVSKAFATGTTVTAGWRHSFLDNELSAQLLSFGALQAYKETRASVGLTQNLLKDFFGYSYRRKLRAAKNRSQSLRSKTRFDVESTTLNFMNVFYQAWLKQQRVFSVRNQLLRRERLLKVTQRKNDRGVAEKPELIQVKALVASTRSDLEVAKAELRTEWERLVVNLKLPSNFLSVDPVDIPTVLDNPMPTGIRVCRQKQPQTTAEIVSLEKTLKALDEELKVAKNEALPDLQLVAGYEGNALNTNGQTPLNDQIFNGDGPAWNVGVKLNWSLDNSKSASERKKAWLDKARAEAQLQLARDKLKTDWSELCRKLKVELENEKTFNSVVKQQAQRVKAENKRFSLGRISVDILVQAEDDLGQWEYRSQQQSIATRGLAWQVQALSGDLYQQIEKQVEARLKGLQ